MINLDFQGRRVWSRSIEREADIFVVARPHLVPPVPYGDINYYSIRIEVYIRRPGMGRGPFALIGQNAHPAGSP